MSASNPIYVIQHNHLDPTWRRCWDRTFDYRGSRYRSYAELEERFINGWLDNARRGATVSEGQAAVIRKYLERNPRRLEEMRELVQRGSFELTCAGETVADTNLPSGETLLRNLAMGQWYFKNTFGAAGTIGWVEDAFGQSAQLPQLFRGVGCRLLLKRSYMTVPGDYWRGLDGSVICVKDAPFTLEIGHAAKIPPCPECRGAGCAHCGDRGLDETAASVGDTDVEAVLAENLAADLAAHPFSVVVVGGEEMVPNPRLPEIIGRMADRHGLDLRFGTFADVARQYSDLLDKVDSPEVEASEQMEANPVSTGCYVSRIRLKQEFRRVENRVNSAERWAAIAWLLGEQYPQEQLTGAWRDLLFCAFHDAITSTHIDAAYSELMEMLRAAATSADGVLSSALEAIEGRIQAGGGDPSLLLFNSDSWARNDPVSITLADMTGVPSLVDECGNEVEVLEAHCSGEDLHLTLRPPEVPPLGYTSVRITPGARPVQAGEIASAPGEIANDFFRIGASERGLTSLFDMRVGREILDTSNFLLNELVLEEDIGHPWGTMQPPSFHEHLSSYTTEVSIRAGKKVSQVSLTGLYKGTDPNTRVLSWRQTVTLYAGYDRIDLKTEVDWDTSQRRLRVAIPTNIPVDAGVYSIPYGSVRRARYEGQMDRMYSTNGDWPAVNWVDLYGEEENRGYALINTGTPSHKIENGVIFMSLLRSPTDSWCLNEPEYYDCPDFDGARDAGRHEFCYSLLPHLGDHRAARVEQRAVELNNPLCLRMSTPRRHGSLGRTHSFLDLATSGSVMVSAVKKAEHGDRLILRLAETAGEPAEATWAVAGTVGPPTVVDYLEHPLEQVAGSLQLGPFKVVTLALDGHA